LGDDGRARCLVKGDCHHGSHFGKGEEARQLNDTQPAMSVTAATVDSAAATSTNFEKGKLVGPHELQDAQVGCRWFK
jgi:hypothetical protein